MAALPYKIIPYSNEESMQLLQYYLSVHLRSIDCHGLLYSAQSKAVHAKGPRSDAGIGRRPYAVSRAAVQPCSRAAVQGRHDTTIHLDAGASEVGKGKIPPCICPKPAALSERVPHPMHAMHRPALGSSINESRA